MAPPTHTPASRRGRKTAERILDAAEALFAERGYAGTSLRDVAAEVGLQVPSLYNHFPSKELLYAAVLDRGVVPVLELLTRFAETPAAERPEPARLVEAVMALLDQHPHLPSLVLHETLAGGRRLTPMLRERIGPVFEAGRDSARASDATGRWSEEELPLLVLALYHVVLGFHTVEPLYREITGADLGAPEARMRQTRLVAQLAEALFAVPGARAPQEEK